VAVEELPDFSQYPVLDIAMINTLKEVMGDAEMQELLSLFFTQHGEAIGAMRTALAKGDAPAVRRNAHTLKGASLQVGLQRVGEIAKRIQDRADAKDLVTVGLLMPLLQAAFEAGEAELSAAGLHVSHS
jgi:HPt (histidine-containing phosphotransfer) domain-containing protein